ncbi:P-loop containing nucleoside triphosphate hydrolase protein [Apiosordaria backusii]|uniref:P-loop containing nucleoside triphosphate hydrolase protein n=1 Tax=Apiosordaria backusii TaxID=314023 RepID=A0AA40BNB1_9PEZI|nr:P-loop containing nucleoside triphosphate hydrolase protein [Apiosordaria backusii]
MASTTDNSARAARLRTLFRETISGTRQVRTPQSAQLFLEAIRIQEHPSSCIETIIGSTAGLDAMRDSVRADLSLRFLIASTLPFLQYLSNPGIKALADGQLLQQVLLVIAHPPTVWNTLVKFFKSHEIPDNSLSGFAWLALELLLLPPTANVDVIDDVRSISESKALLKSEGHVAREYGYMIQKVLRIRGSLDGGAPGTAGPGGRHDNDLADFRRISIYPTTDEFLSTQLPFYQTAVDVRETDLEKRPSVHLDNQFRLLREDMLAELREDLQVAMGSKKGGNRRSFMLGRLEPAGFDTGDSSRGRYKPCTLLVRCFEGLHFLERMKPEERKKYLKDEPGLLRHQAFGVLCRDKEIFGFAFVDRDPDNLAKSPPIVSLQFTDDNGLRNAILALTLPKRELVQFILVGTPVFAYEPVLLGLQRSTDLALLDLLVNPSSIATSDFTIKAGLRPLVAKLLRGSKALEDDGTVDIDTRNGTISIDKSQLIALITSLTRPVSLVQGPPGTGKSFIGAQIARCLYEAGLRILVLSYTNHALDQFMEDLLDVAIPAEAMVRIGSKAKCTDRTTALLLSEQKGNYRRSRDGWLIVDNFKQKAAKLAAELQQMLQNYFRSTFQWQEISEYLEFSDPDAHFLKALQVPEDENGWRRTGKGGKEVGEDYLYKQWVSGNGPGVFKNNIPSSARGIWNMPREVRLRHIERWTRAMAEERLHTLQEVARQYAEVQRDLDVQFSQSDNHIVRQKSIIGCTTTGAAKHVRLIRAAEPDVILVEEAGEILESHILTALSSTVKQLVLIGDHKQLRPKINNYALSVERGDGFDLNRSLFERLILQGAEHATLQKQHRMIPEISCFARELTYPELLDGPKTSGRERIRGLQNRVVFLSHTKPEDVDKAIKDRRDPGAKESKKNQFEAEMVLRCVKYFGQQGYSSNRIVVLTPYLGQLRVLRDVFSKNKHDLEISEMDKAELIRAGLISEAAAKVDKKPVRISTIDNYQGEESDIVIASLTRSNSSGDIGFMSAPERLNVLITRARNCLVLIGNMETFKQSKKGRATWVPFFDLLNKNGNLYDGLPVRCEKHPQTVALLKEPLDFDKSCPDGGCTEPCEALLKCGVHKCRSRCHRIDDHTKAECNQLITRVCARQHKAKVRCGRQNEGCVHCIKEDQEMERKAKRDLKLEEDRKAREEAYTRTLKEIQDEIEHQKRVNKYHAEERHRSETIEQQKADLEALKEAEIKLRQQNKQRAEAQSRSKAASASQTAKKAPINASEDWSSDARAEWEFLKESEPGTYSKALDELMSMIGLEDVKQEFLNIKSKVDTALRQDVSLAKERFSCSMLGNPGTGKTTVARLYAEFLTELCVIPGNCFKENTGAGLANIGVSGCTKLIDEILNAGGGVLFIDEAYQLTSGNNPGGAAVLDYLLAEVENQRGKIVFILAGYSKQMESFFAHNPGLPSRFPVDMTFADYTDEELQRILELKINQKYSGAMDCADGLRGLFCRIVSRRIGRGRGKEGFGNARSVENTLDIISRRQANRLRGERKGGAKPNDLFFTKEDLIGPEPAEALTKCGAWKELQRLTGLQSVKEAVRSLVDSIQQNYLRELEEKPPIEYSLNKVFMGNPGTGKTTVAKLYGAILVKLGLLSKGEVVVKNPSDFVGGALGQSEQQTKGILAATVGKVLVIDEAYGLYGGGNSQGSISDPYKTAVIDTIVAEVQSVPGDDRCVLLLGYKDQMETMFQNVNPGLSRRFPIASGFAFEDFSDEDILKIFHLKLKKQGYKATPQAIDVAMEIIKRARNRPNFGNAGEIDILLDAAKARHQRRFSKGETKDDSLFDAVDFDENFDRANKSTASVKQLFEGTVGCEDTVKLLEGYQDIVRTLKPLDMDPKENIPFNFLFRGPPGTGKTTTAKKMGKVFYDMGFLSTDEVVECSATDLIGQYVGQTGPKVQHLLDKALGKVLFVDEAYRLAEGHFAKEAMDELVDSVTKDRYFKKLIIILAGYENDINRLMSVNSGLTSRFPAVIDFRSLTADECLTLLCQLLRKQKLGLKSRGKDLDLTCLVAATSAFRREVINYFTHLTAQDNWASARDVQSVSRAIFNKLLKDKTGLASGRLVLTEAVVTAELRAMLDERASRSNFAAPEINLQELLRAPPPLPPQNLPYRPAMHTTTTAHLHQTELEAQPLAEEPEKEQPKAPEIKPVDPNNGDSWIKRDAGVSDAVWEQLQRDRQAEEQRDEEYRKLLEAKENATEAAREKIVARLLEEEARRRKEEAVKEKLKAMGVCPVGFPWIKQAEGYRCAGGSHFIGNVDLGKL